MALRYTLPLGSKDTIKNLVFTILTKESPLKLVELTHLIRRRYGRQVTFQAVRKAALELVQEGVLKKTIKEFSINKEWIFDAKKQLDALYLEISREHQRPTRVDSIRGEVSVFSFDSLNQLMKFWQDIIDDWFEHFKSGDPNINAYQGRHLWEALLHPDREKQMMGRLKRKGIISYTLGTGNTPLDNYIGRFYAKIGLRVGFIPAKSLVDRTYYVGTYGDMIVETKYPQELATRLEAFFKKANTIEELDLVELSEIVNSMNKVQLTVIRNHGMAQQINNSIISQIGGT